MKYARRVDKVSITGGSHNDNKRYCHPPDKLRNNDIVNTPKRRHFEVIASKWQRFDVITTLLLRQVFGGQWRQIWYHSNSCCRLAAPNHDDVIKWKQFPRYWPFVRGIHRSPLNSPHKGQWRGALMFSLICTRINGWVNNGEAGDLRRHRAHYDVIVMVIIIWLWHPTMFTKWQLKKVGIMTTLGVQCIWH